jgi:GT2 family glycosyltransferase
MKPFAPWTIIHLDLGSGFPSLAPTEGRGPTLLFLWHCGIPLGQLEIVPELAPLSPQELTRLIVRAVTPAVGDHILKKGFHAALPVRKAAPPIPPDLAEVASVRDPLKRMEMQMSLSTAGAKRMGASVVVCTRDRPEQLSRCLDAMKNLVVSPEEIIVVDNGSATAATRDIASGFPGIRYVREPKRGLSAARNAGIRASTCDIIAFTDDDVVIHPHWLIRIAAAFENPRTLAVTGIVLPGELKTEAQVRFQQGLGGPPWGYRTVNYGPDFLEQAKGYGAPVWLIGAGANMAFRREAFDVAGYFDERLGAGTSGCSEDSEMWYRILAEGWECRYEPTAVVYHYHRQETEELRKQLYAYMRGHVVALLVQFERYRHWGNLVRLLVLLPGHYLKSLLHWWLHGFKPKHQMLFPQILGCFAGCVYYISRPSCRSRHQSAEGAHHS